MKNSTIKALAVIVSGSVIFTACNGLGKMVKNAPKITYEVTPKVLEMHGDSVKIQVSGKYPAKYFAKKAVLTITPVIKYNGGEKKLNTITAVGEGSGGNGTIIATATGGSFLKSDITAYTPEMKDCELVIRCSGTMKSKTKDFPEMKVAVGTIVTPLLLKNDEKALMGKDAFTKIQPVSTGGNIFYVVNQSTVRPTEMSSADMKAMKDFIAKGVAMGYTFKNMSVSAYASPDGEQSLNANLAGDRAKSATKAMMGVFGDKKTMVGAGKQESFYSTVTTAEDWEGFKKLMEASSIADKDLILRVLTMYSDLDVREKEIKNLAKTYVEVSDKILPKLRRSVLTLNAEKNSRTDEQLSKLSTSTPDSLSAEEILYAATLTTDMNTKLNIYKAAERMYPADWRGINNVGYVYLMQNKINEAQAQFDKANKVAPNNSAVTNNMGIVARWKGDRKAAEDYYKLAGSSPEVNYNMGILDIMKGHYSDAVVNFGSTNSFNAALAKVLSGSPSEGLPILDNSNDKDAAVSFYLKAIIGARTSNKDLMINNLKSAINKDASFKAMAKDDKEFVKYKDDADFKALAN